MGHPTSGSGHSPALPPEKRSWSSARSRGRVAPLSIDPADGRVAIDEIPVAAVIHDVVDLDILAANPAAALLYGYSPGEMQALTMRDLSVPEELPALRAADGPRAVGAPDGGPAHHRTRAGVVVPLRVLASDIVYDGRAARLTLLRPWSDGGQRSSPSAPAPEPADLRRALDDAQTSLRMAQHAARVGTYDFDVATQVLTCSDELYRIVGYPSERRFGMRTYLDVVHPDDRAMVQAKIAFALENRLPARFEHRFVRRDGSIRWLESSAEPVLDDGGRVIRLFGTGTDITEHKAAEAHLAFLVNNDPLTGLPNRGVILERLADALAASRRSGRHVAVVLLDLDDFKRVNDTYGHAEGDRILTICAARLRACARPSDLVGRIGGDEFIVVLDDMESPAGAARAVQRMQTALAKPVALGDIKLALRASFGISCSPSDSPLAEALIGFADMAMYRSKQTRRGGYTFFEPGLQQAASDRLRLEDDLRRAIRDRRLVVHYQPIVNGDSRRVEGFEALVRWPRADRVMQPAEFIPLAEETGLIVPLGEFVLHEACRTLAALHADGFEGLRLAVNLSPRQLGDDNLLDMCRSALAATGIPPSLLFLEITESYLVTDPVHAAALLNEISALGIRIALDDFGTGYSALSFLRRFPVHLLKLDRSFVTEIVPSETDRVIVSTILALAHALRMGSVAEGVETQEQYAALTALGCDSFQGFYFARPMSSADLGRFIAHAGHEPALV